MDFSLSTIRRAVARQLAEFLRGLHSFATSEAQHLALILRDLERTIFAADYARYHLDRGNNTRVATLLATLREYMAAHTM